MRRIQRDICHEDNIIKALTKGENPIFKEIWRLLQFACAYGVYLGRRVPLEKTDSGKGISENTFDGGWKGFIYLLGVVETNGPDCLMPSTENDDFLAQLFEEYANAGLHALWDEIADSRAPLDILITILLKCTSNQQRTPLLSGLL